MKSKLKIFLINDTENGILQFFRYFFVGGIAAFANFLFLYIFTDVFQIYYMFSNILSFLIGLIVNYVLSKKFIFRIDAGDKKVEFLIYGLIGGTGLVFDTGLMYLFTDIIGFHYLISKVLSTAIVFIWNFLARKYFYANAKNGKKWENKK